MTRETEVERERLIENGRAIMAGCTDLDIPQIV